MLAIVPVAQEGGMPVALPPVPTILGEPISTTEVVDFHLIVVRVKGRISKPVLLQLVKATLVEIGCSIASPVLMGGSI